ncbi:MAG: zraS 6, partial [Phycisphaerales bacterium]|nr:zraS 6 [Phycisphaerales bacterium]
AFAYFVVRHGVMQLVVERAAVYAAVATAALLLHELAVRPAAARLSGRAGVNPAVVEVLALLALVCGYPPLRQRVAEALRYLMGERVKPVRDRTRRLAVRISERAADPPAELLRWFAPALRDALGVRSVRVWLFGPAGEVAAAAGDADVRVGDDDVPVGNGIGSGGGGLPRALPAADAVRLRATLAGHGLAACTVRDAPDAAVRANLRAAGASLAIALRHRDVDGVLLVGPRPGNRDLGDEAANAAVLLAEQLAVTLGVGRLHADRVAAERRAAQAEKLAVLGLVAGSIAHEVKNPLSAIKTIATVLAEDLGPDHPRVEDALLIRSEAERMAAATARLLRFARPAGAGPATGRPVSVAKVLSGTAYVMGHVARGRGVALRYAAAPGVGADRDVGPPAAAAATGPAFLDPLEVVADEDGLREVFTNLVANAIEAAAGELAPGGSAGHRSPVVTITARRAGDRVAVEVADDGPGVPEAVRDRLFEPFVTARASGTGLGLYVVGQRVREAGGTVRCDSPIGFEGGTRFVVEMPAAGPPPRVEERIPRPAGTALPTVLPV